ncbi:MAG: MFS transporter [Firmicutes bacterium HGW-Firmicutes-14]|nr:MAG: MFS transporter [Firmicutes bacterium HGW-Firmicutes-14]
MNDSSPSPKAQPQGSIHERLTRGRRRQILLTVAIGTFMAPLDSSVVNIALPTIGAHFDATLAVVEWVIMAYLLMISSLLLIFGRLGDLYGHKKIYISGFVVFTIGSLMCALAPSITLLILFRGFQAIGAGMLMAMGPAIITDVAPPSERGKFLGVIAVSVSIALTAGPVVGGLLTDHFGWPSIFFINIPIGILVSILAYRVLPDSGGRQAQPFDLKGAVTAFLALAFILIPLSYTEKLGWKNPYILGALAAGLGLLLFFIYLESRIRHPMVDLTLFRNRLFSMGNLSALLNYMAMFSVILIMPFYLQQLRELSPSQAGLFLIPTPLTTMIIAPLSGAVSDRVDTRYISSLGMAVTTLGLWLLSGLKADSPVSMIVASMVVVGIGSGMFQTPNNSAIMGAVPVNRRGIASGMLAIMRNLGMVLGVAVSGAIFSSRRAYLTELFASQGLAGLELKSQAFTGAMNITFMAGVVIAGIGIVTSLIRGCAAAK